MASTSLFTPLSITKPTRNLVSFPPEFSFTPNEHIQKKRKFPVLRVASIPHQPINVDYMETEFGGHGVTFTDIGDSCVVTMGLDNGSLANLLLPSGLITSYKALMWHGGTLEVIHTSVSEGENGGAVIQGGVALALNCGRDDGVSWSPSSWALHDVSGNPQKSIQVELISRDAENMIEVKYKVTLEADVLSSEFILSNSKSSSLQIMGSVVSHLIVSTPDAAYAIGLEGSNFFSRPPILSNFSIFPPNSSRRNGKSFSNLRDQMAKGYTFGWGENETENGDSEEAEEEIEGEENDNYKHLTEKMSRIYTNAPRNFTLIDRGRRNSVIVGRDGFEELYMFSPGSDHEWYGKYAYICVGQMAMLQPIILGPKDVWRGAQYLHNPNL